MKKMSKDLNIDMSHEKVELIDDKEIGREEWETYYVYMEYICDFMEKLAKLEDYPEIQHN
jgi:anoctamin-10